MRRAVKPPRLDELGQLLRTEMFVGLLAGHAQGAHQPMAARASGQAKRIANGTRLAAVDLGSNSFRLEIGRYEFGHVQRVEYLKETVRQGNGLDEDRNLTRDAME
eukprot:gene3746-5354_t